MIYYSIRGVIMENNFRGQVVAYVRVSTVEQHEGRQINIIKEKYNVDQWFSEKVSAKNANREQLQQLLKYIRKGDMVVVSELSRIARNLKDLKDILDNIDQKGAYFVSVKENINTLDNSATGKLLINLMGTLSEFERDLILERQREGIALAKEQGKYKGRKKIEFPSNWKEVYTKWKCREITATKAMELLGLKRNTFYNLLKEYETSNLPTTLKKSKDIIAKMPPEEVKIRVEEAYKSAYNMDNPSLTLLRVVKTPIEKKAYIDRWVYVHRDQIDTLYHKDITLSEIQDIIEMIVTRFSGSETLDYWDMAEFVHNDLEEMEMVTSCTKAMLANTFLLLGYEILDNDTNIRINEFYCDAHMNLCYR